MIGELSPGLVLILGAIVVPLVRGHVRAVLILALPVAACWQLLALPTGQLGVVRIFDLTLVTLRVDRLSLMFGYVFLIEGRQKRNKSEKRKEEDPFPPELIQKWEALWKITIKKQDKDSKKILWS